MKKLKRLNLILASFVLSGSLVFPLLGNIAKVAAAGDPPTIINNFAVDYQAEPDVIHVTWDAPTSAGSSAITGYKVEWSPYGRNDWSDPISTSSTHYDLSTSDGIAKDHVYDIKAWAVNSDGDGEYDQINDVLYGIQVYDITTCQELQNMNNDLEGTYTLANNIDCSASEHWDSDKGFAPIGGTVFLDNAFTGSLDGQGHTISGLHINRPDEQVVGLFGSIATVASVSNLHLTNADIVGNTFVGGISGAILEGGTINNVSFMGEVDGSTAVGLTEEFPLAGVGGLVGASFGGDVDMPATITNSYSDGILSVDATGDTVFNAGGGLVGLLMNNSVLNNSYSTDQIFLGSNKVVAGGAVGFAGPFLGDGTVTIDSVYANAILHAVDGSMIGGLVGAMENARLSNSFSASQLEGSGSFYAGGLLGENDSGDVLVNNFFDSARSGGVVDCVFDSGPGIDGCTAINTDDSPDVGYFLGNHINEPMHSWDFNKVWRTVNSGYPVLDLREVTPPSSSGHHNKKTLKEVKKDLSLVRSPSLPTVSKPAEIKLGDYTDYIDGSGHLLSGLMIGQVIHFDIVVNGKVEHHTITIKDIGDGFIVVTIASKPFDIRLNLDDPQTISLEGQNVMVAQLTGLDGSSASLTFAKVSVPTEIAQPVAAQVATTLAPANKKGSNMGLWVVVAAISLMTAVVAINRKKHSIKK